MPDVGEDMTNRYTSGGAYTQDGVTKLLRASTDSTIKSLVADFDLHALQSMLTEPIEGILPDYSTVTSAYQRWIVNSSTPDFITDAITTNMVPNAKDNDIVFSVQTSSPSDSAPVAFIVRSPVGGEIAWRKDWGRYSYYDAVAGAWKILGKNIYIEDLADVFADTWPETGGV